MRTTDEHELRSNLEAREATSTMRFHTVTVLLMTVMLTAGCAQLQQFNRFFLSQCAEDGPNLEQELDVVFHPVDLSGYLE